MKCKIFEETSSTELERKLNNFFEGKDYSFQKYSQSPKILSINYSYDRNLKGLYPNIYSALVVYEE